MSASSSGRNAVGANNAGGKPGDDAPPGTPGTGENLCPTCNGSGRVNGAPCTDCGGTGKVTTAIGGG